MRLTIGRVLVYRPLYGQTLTSLTRRAQFGYAAGRGSAAACVTRGRSGESSWDWLPPGTSPISMRLDNPGVSSLSGSGLTAREESYPFTKTVSRHKWSVIDDEDMRRLLDFELGTGNGGYTNMCNMYGLIIVDRLNREVEYLMYEYIGMCDDDNGSSINYFTH